MSAPTTSTGESQAAIFQRRLQGASDRRCPQAAACQNVGHAERIVSSLAGALLVGYGLSRRRPGALGVAALGGGLLYRGMTGRCHLYSALGVDTAHRNQATVIPAHRGAKVEKTITILRNPADLYGFWRELENLPRVMKHLKSVEVIDRDRSHWVAEGPLGKEVHWDAEVFNESENEFFAWRSLPGGDIDTAGSVHFRELPGGRGAEVTVSMKYDPPAGKVGVMIASLMGADLEQIITEDLRRFRELMEIGEALTTERRAMGQGY